MMNLVRLTRFSAAGYGAVLSLAFTATLFSGAAHAAWPFGVHGTLTETPNNLSMEEVVRARTASNGDLIVAGHFKGDTKFGGGSSAVTLNSLGDQDVFVARISASGQLMWVRQIGGVSNDTVSGLALDSGDNVYVVGAFSGSLSAGGVTVNSHGSQDGFVLRLDSQGVPKWGHAVGGSGIDRLDDVVVLAGDTTVIPTVPESLVVLGTYNGTAQLGTSGISVAATTASNGSDGKGTDALLFRMSINDEPGNDEWKWQRNLGSSTSTEGSRLVLDPDGRLHLAGRRRGASGGGTGVMLDSRFDTFYDLGGTLNGWQVTPQEGGGYAHLISSLHWAFSPGFPGQGNAEYPLPLLAIRGRAVAVETSSGMNANGAEQLKLEVALYRGRNITIWSGFPINSGGYVLSSNLSEYPQYGEDLVLEYQKSNGSWATMHTFYGGGTPGELINLFGENSIKLNPGDPATAEAFRDGVKFRLRKVNAWGEWLGSDEWSWWHVAAIKISRVDPWAGFVMTFANPQGATAPGIGNSFAMANGARVKDMTAANVPGAGVRLFLFGDHDGQISYGSAGQSNCPQPNPAPAVGAFVAGFSVGGGTYDCQWSRTLAGASGGGLTAFGDKVYLTGGFKGSLNLGGSAAALTSNATGNSPGQDVFVAALSGVNGIPAWATGGKVAGTGETHPNPPSSIGGTGTDIGLAISRQSSNALYVGGRFEDIAEIGPIDTIATVTGGDGFAFVLRTDGSFPLPQTWTVGVPIVPPVGAVTSSLVLQPDFYIAQGEGMVQVSALGSEYRWFTWAKAPGVGTGYQLIPLQPTPELEIRWRDSTDLTATSRIAVGGRGAWPKEPCTDTQMNGCYQVHTLGAPVEIKPASNQYQVVEVVNPTDGASNATHSSGVFTAQRTGMSVIVYIDGPSIDVTQFPSWVEVVRSLQYEALPRRSETIPGFIDGQEVEIGKKLVNTYHNEPGRSGLVINELAYYDGTGTDAAYNRAARTGTIFPVNRYSSARTSDAGRELVVAWYRRKAKGVYWPEHAVRYAPRWPFNPERIVVASEQGGEAFGQAPLAPANYPQARIYVQSNYWLPGFNPNDEHALMAPSSIGSGVDAVFALRADFGSNLENDRAAPSDPYVLVKYFNNTAQDWAFRVYKVDALGGGFTRFRYSGVAGTTVSPPYPMRLLPACDESFVVGQGEGEPPPPPFYQDHKAQIWAASAGSGQVRYFYPIQPGFYRDLDNDNVNDFAVGECAPWLERLPKGEDDPTGAGQPIAVQYDIQWPETAPLLIAGETLLSPKRGLPEIYNQAAAKVVYDQLQSDNPDAEPSKVLAQMFDPLSSRWVRLVNTGEIELSMRTDGFYDIGGLPASLSERMYYDGMNRRLVLSGVFDESGVGEPKLLLNILSKRERAILKQADGGDGTEQSAFDGDCSDGSCTWDQAVEALFRLSRNPQKIERVCTSSELDRNRVRNCLASRPFDPEIDMLAGYEDPNGNGVLQPLSSMGGSALSAGAAQGSGYMTLAFNDDESLGSLPVSLEVIKVGCLTSTTTTPPINAPYQGQINIIAPDDIFDEQLVLRHSGDFGGRPDELAFEWYFHPDANGTPPMPLPDPEHGQMHGWIAFPVSDPNGALEISIEGANIQTLSDNWYVSRYRGLPLCNNQNTWSLWAGQPGGTPTQPRAQLAEGWVKRVLGRLNPFEARVQDFGASSTDNYASMLIQLGERYAGPIALNSDPDNLNSIGLIEAYTTVMRRAMQLSVDSTPPVDYGPANAAILLVASRLVKFYTLLGNEAYADAQDPTIAIDSDGGTLSLSPTIFNFQNQLESLLDEELVLLRGRDDSHGPVAATPVYNRLFWNFTTGDGEVAYALSYNISDQDVNGVVNEYDARILFPQGHGDAWGHYLTAMTTYYSLLRHPYYSWNPQSEAVLVAGAPINVDFLDERQFVQTAMYKARAGAEVVDLTYRKAYTEDPNGQYQGYEDTNAQRAWGLSEWGRRAGMGAYFDWVTANAILPEQDPNPAHVGIQRIQRDSISELSEIVGHYATIQGQVDKADRGLNPLGLAKNVVSFDIDPAQLICTGNPCNVKTQFEQVWDRAMGALTNALKVWDYANQLSNQLRRTQESADDLWDNSIAQETDFANQLIEIFGYPYADDIGGSGTYPDGYNGPDLYHYMYIDAPALAGTAFDFDTPIEDLGVKQVKRWKGYFSPMGNGLGFFNTKVNPILGGDAPDGVDCTLFPMGAGCALGDKPYGEVLEVDYVMLQSPAVGSYFTKPEEWTGQRRAPGRIQQTLQELLMAQVSLKQGILEYDKMRLDMEATIATLRATFDTQASNINVAHQQRQTLGGLTAGAQLAQAAATVAHRVATGIDTTFDTAKECVPDNMIVGLAGGGDLFSTIKCAIDGASVAAFVVDTVGDGLEIAGNAIEAAKEDVSEMNAIRTLINDANLELYNIAGDVDALMREEPMLRSEIFARAQVVQQLMGEYHAALAEGLRTLEQLQVFRRSGAAATQQNRYKDMAFRIFRNDALQKYRAAFDLAARYVYLAASAYDYETNLLGNNTKAGRKFLTNVVKERSIGQILDGTPIPGTPGLADTMAQLKLNFDVLKGQMGFNNPQVETQRFSLRRELFRIEDGEEGDEAWRRTLEAARVSDLRQLPEYRRYARPFAPESAGPQPGLVFEFSTNVTFGLNFFGWDLGPYDSSYNSSRFATRIRSVGAWFGNYANLPLADDPNVYLIPVGADVLRSPDPLDFTVREWQIVDQAIPVPFPIGTVDLNSYDWLPTHNLDGAQTDVRRYPMMRAYHFSEPFDESQVTNDSRLVGRSVWNRKWLLIIPGGTFLSDSQEGLDTFIQGARIPGGGGARDGNGVDDIRVFFKTYSYSGN